MRGLIEHDGALRVRNLPEQGLSPLLVRQEAKKYEFVGGYARNRERGGERRGSRDRLDPDLVPKTLSCLAHELGAWVGNPRSARIGHERHMLPLPQELEDPGGG